MRFIFKKIILAIWMVLFLFSAASSPAQAKFDLTGFSSGDVRSMTDTVQSRVLDNMGVNPVEMANMIQTMNTSRQKKNPPAVSIIFNPTDPVEGEKVTAFATPTYLMNDPKDLYFTWFLKTEDCERTGNPDEVQSEKCDLNGDGEVDVEDWKIKAARIIANDDFNWEEADYSGSNDSDGYDASIGGDDQGGKNSYCYIHDTRSGNEYPIECAHLFPNAPGEETGDNSFGVQEEEFWHTDPRSDDTAHTGNTDEANVAGLGIEKFTWVYNQKDQVGVVVEGVSVEPTQYYDSSMKTMWALPKSMCDVEANFDYPKSSSDVVSVESDTPEFGQTTTVTQTNIQELGDKANTMANITTTVTTTTTVTDNITGAIISETSTSEASDEITDISEDMSIENFESATDLNECLYDNLISPSDNGPQSEKLNVALTYFPTSPINDPGNYTSSSLSSGDYLTVQSAIDNAKDSAYLQYKWEVFASNEANPDSWGSPFIRSELPEATQMIGIGLETFKFKLNLENPKKYLKVKLTAKENVGHNLFREGHDYVVVPINSTGKQIQAYSTNASDSPSPVISMTGSEMCTGDIEKALCPVAKNQIIGVKVDINSPYEFLWTIDGEPFVYQSCFFTGCNPEKQTNTAFFPVLKEKGERYTINLTATDQVTGNKINLTKIFEVNDPQIKIVSASQSSCGPNLLGSYVDLDGKTWPDYSKANYWALSGSSFSLTTETSGFAPALNDTTWYVDGQVVNEANSVALGYTLNNGVLTLPSKYPLESYNVTVNALYYQNEAVRRALKTYWGLSYNQLYEKVAADSISVTMQDSAPIVAKMKGQKTFASLFLSAPSYFSFLLRIVLTTFLIIFASRLIFMFFPKVNKN